MQIDALRLSEHLARSLAPVYLVIGEEPLLAQEACDAIRAAARAAGYTDRSVHDAGAGADWDRLFSDSQALSLFATRRLIEIRLPTGKAGADGAEVLTGLAQAAPPDTVILITAPKIEKSARDAAWVDAVGTKGAIVTARALSPRDLPGWIATRAKAGGLRLTADAVERLVYHTEGNLLACAQELEKLSLLYDSGTEISESDLDGVLADNARFTVYRLVDAALNAEHANAARMLAALRAEGFEPVLVSWALTRELRSLADASLAMAAGASAGDALRSAKVWSSRQPLVAKALKRFKPTGWLALLASAAHIDRVIKGRAPGDTWLEIERLVLRLSGMKAPELFAE
jgi:DNA polymerase-3 subunit delta